MLRLLNTSKLPVCYLRSLKIIPTFTSGRFNSTVLTHQEKSSEVLEEPPKAESAAEPQDVPWYLRYDVTSELETARKIVLPEIPAHAPPQIEEFLNLLAKDYGMEDIHLFDMTELAEDHEFKENNKNIDFIIILTGKSEKHIYKAASELRTYLKHQYNTIPLLEGMVSSAKTPAMRRRLLRRARKGPLATDNDYGRAANSWVLCSHENIDIHMLTSPRREELTLETLWCKPEDMEKYTPQTVQNVESDNIFSGIRRFHTMTHFRRLYWLKLPNLESYLCQLNAKSSELDDDKAMQLKNMFEDAFQNPSLGDYNIRYQFWKTLHMLKPESFSFKDAESALLQKYASELSPELISLEKSNDVTEYAQLLLDTPTRKQDKQLSDEALDKLSKFITTLYQFSSDKFTLSSNPKLLPLLWRLCYLEKSDQLTPKIVDEIIHEGKKITTFSAEPLVSLASNNLRNVLLLLDHHTQKVEPGSVPTNALSELILFTYGNASKWDKFWYQWEVTWFTRTVEPSAAIEKWVRLAVYLSARGDKTNMRKFLLEYWSNSSLVSGSFLRLFEQNGKKFNSESEAVAFQKAVEVMVTELASGGETPFEGITEYVESIVHS